MSKIRLDSNDPLEWFSRQIMGTPNTARYLGQHLGVPIFQVVTIMHATGAMDKIPSDDTA